MLMSSCSQSSWEQLLNVCCELPVHMFMNNIFILKVYTWEKILNIIFLFRIKILQCYLRIYSLNTCIGIYLSQTVHKKSLVYCLCKSVKYPSSFNECTNQSWDYWILNFLIICDCRYGAKIRFPHALVMTFLFKRGR